MKSAHDLAHQRRRHETVDKIPLQGVVCLLTTGGLIRVGRPAHRVANRQPMEIIGGHAPHREPSTEANRTRTLRAGCEHDVVQPWLPVVIMPRARWLGNVGIPLSRPTRDNAPPSGHAAAEEWPRGGGTLERGITPLHTRRRPHTGHRSGWSSPRWLHAVCQSRTAALTTGPCPNCSRHRSNAAHLLGAYSP